MVFTIAIKKKKKKLAMVNTWLTSQDASQEHMIHLLDRKFRVKNSRMTRIYIQTIRIWYHPLQLPLTQNSTSIDL